MMYLSWFTGTMKRIFNVDVNIDEVSYEAFDFYHEELDDLLIPAEHLEKLPDPLLLETFSYVDDKGYEWIGGFVMEEEMKKKLYEVWIRNGDILPMRCISTKNHLTFFAKQNSRHFLLLSHDKTNWISIYNCRMYERQ